MPQLVAYFAFRRSHDALDDELRADDLHADAELQVGRKKYTGIGFSARFAFGPTISARAHRLIAAPPS